MIQRSNFDQSLIQETGAVGATIPLRRELADRTVQRIVVDALKTVDLGMQDANACEGTLWLHQPAPELGWVEKIRGKAREDVGQMIGNSASVVIVEFKDENAKQVLLNVLTGTNSSQLGESTLLINATSEEVRARIFGQRHTLTNVTIPKIDPEKIHQDADPTFAMTEVLIVNDPGAFSSSSEDSGKGTLIFEKSSREGIELKDALEQIDIVEITKKVSTLLGLPMPKYLPFYLPPPGSEGSHVLNTNKVHYSIVGDRARMTLIERGIQRRLIALNLEGLTPTDRENICVHEIAHYLLSDMPANETFLEGTAETVCWLYAQVFGKKNFWRSAGSPSKNSGGIWRFW